MKKIFAFAIIAMFTTFTMSSCNSAKSLVNNTGLSSQLLSGIGSSLFSNIGSLPGLSGVASKLSLASKLSSVIKGGTMVNAFKGLLASKYQLPLSGISNAYSSFKNLQDVAGFIGKNASPSILNAFK